MLEVVVPRSALTSRPTLPHPVPPPPHSALRLGHADYDSPPTRASDINLSATTHQAARTTTAAALPITGQFVFTPFGMLPTTN